MSNSIGIKVFGVGLAVVICIWFIISDPIPQELHYHGFANDLMLFGIPNFWNVLSNLPFVIIGLVGIQWVCIKINDSILTSLEFWLFVGLMGIGFGSSYYHFNPNISTLFWDRLPMALVFSILFVVVVRDFASYTLSQRIKWPIIICSVGTVFYWRFTEVLGCGDLRPYALVQFIPMLCIPYFLWLNKYRKKSIYIWLSLVFYVLAKLFEHFDAQLFEITQFMAGHPIKHLLAAGAMIFIFKHIQKNRL